jgi:hypothetical protein
MKRLLLAAALTISTAAHAEPQQSWTLLDIGHGKCIDPASIELPTPRAGSEWLRTTGNPVTIQVIRDADGRPDTSG